ALLAKQFILIMSFFAFIYANRYIKDRNIPGGDYYILGLFAVLGMQIMSSGYSFLTIYLGLELLSLSLYAMTALQKESKPATEAAMKYFVMGALASGLLLYGISLLYGLTGSVQIVDIMNALKTGSHSPLIVGLSLAFILVGLLFKFGAVPFHMWVPDVYQ